MKSNKKENWKIPIKISLWECRTTHDILYREAESFPLPGILEAIPKGISRKQFNRLKLAFEDVIDGISS